MKIYLFVIITILLISFSVHAQPTPTPVPMPTFTPNPAEAPTPRPDQLNKNDIAGVNGFTVNVKSAELTCEMNGATKEVRFKAAFDQTFYEIERTSLIFGQTDLLKRFRDADYYHLMDLKEEDNPRLSLTWIGEEDNHIVFSLSAADFDKNKKYSLFLRGVKLKNGKAEENPTVTMVEVSSNCAEIPGKFGTVAPVKAESTPSVYEFAMSNFHLNKSNPEIKVSFAMNGERVTSPFYATTVAAEPFELKRLGLAGAYSIVPFFINLEKNDSPGSEVDKLKFGGKFRHLFVFEDDGKYTTDDPDTTPFIGIRSEISAQVETTTKFKTGNVILGLKTGLPINVYQTRSRSMRFTPFVGFDFGRRVFDGNSTSKEKWIARPSLGAEFYFTPFRTEKDIPYLLEMSYIHRFFIRPEEIYTRNADRKAIVEGLSTNPKGYFTAQLTLWQTKFISPFIRYTYGRDAPRYLLEDHKYVFGIQANFDWGAK
jgi:hypothetical protein